MVIKSQTFTYHSSVGMNAHIIHSAYVIKYCVTWLYGMASINRPLLLMLECMYVASIKNVIRCGHYSRVSTIIGVAFNQEVWPLFKGSYYYRRGF